MEKILLILIVFSTLSTCQKSEDDAIELKNEDYLIFGHMYGMCQGEQCVEIFKLTDKKLFEDINDDYFRKDINFVELDNNKFEQVKDLMDFFPNELLKEDKKVFGCPDCTDGGALVVEYMHEGKLRKWTIDMFKDNVPEYLHEFIDKVNEKIKLLQ